MTMIIAINLTDSFN